MHYTAFHSPHKRSEEPLIKVKPLPSTKCGYVVPAMPFSLMPMSAPTVLYIEDDTDDVFFFRRALRALNVDCNLRTLSNVASAKSYLAGKPPYNDRDRFPMPKLLLTDMTIPGIGESSMDLDSWVRSTPEIANLPILCATGNDQPRIIAHFASLGITCYHKTSEMTDIASAVKTALKEIHPG